MKLESAIKYFSPKTMNISGASPGTSSDSLTGTDLMGAIGMCQSKSPFGMAAYMAKSGVSNDDRYRTIEQLLSYAHRTAPKLVIKAAGSSLGKCLVILSKLAFEEYSRSAATTRPCNDCDGQGLKYSIKNVMIHPGCGDPLSERHTPAKYRLDTVEEMCVTCHGKGRISARCRCNGTGRVRDLEESARQGAPVDRSCERCSGLGFKRMPSSRAFQAIRTLVPELTQPTWSRNWKPFFEMLVTKCEVEENHADTIFQKATK